MDRGCHGESPRQKRSFTPLSLPLNGYGPYRAGPGAASPALVFVLRRVVPIVMTQPRLRIETLVAAAWCPVEPLVHVP